MTELTEVLKKGTMDSIVIQLQKYINSHWQYLWDKHLADTQRIFTEQSQGPAYAFYAGKLFSSLGSEIKTAGLTTVPDFPGNFQQSHEQGPEEKRVRRFWCVLYRDKDNALGTLVTHFYHDHTHLQLPKIPKITNLEEIDPGAIQQTINQI